MHPTQKPLSLCEYMINTYSNAGDCVLDFCGGSGAIPLAAKNLGRKYIVIEKDHKYYDVIVDRLK